MRLTAIVVIAAGLWSVAPARAANPTPIPATGSAPGVFDAIQHQVQTVFNKCHGAIVRIEAVDQRGYLSGTGFFIDPNGTLYTSFTVGGETRDIQVAFNGQHYNAERLVSDMRSGIAILKINAETPFLTFGDSQKLTVASPVIAIGYPLDLPLTPVFGTVGGFDLKYQGRLFATTHIRANIPVQRGEGGAPLLDARGDVVGILISRVESGGASHVLPIEAAEKVRKDFVRFHKVRPGWLGVSVKPLETPVNGSTAAIEGTISDSPAEKAGLQSGDVIVQVGNRRVNCPEDVLDASFFLTAEDQTTVRVERDGSERDFNITPIDNPLNRPPIASFDSTTEAPETPSPALKIGH